MNDEVEIEEVDFTEVRKRLYLEDLKARHRRRMLWWRTRWGAAFLLTFFFGYFLKDIVRTSCRSSPEPPLR